jgi:tRNA G18 (ribose-2'-O)-methylase SpoU
MRIDPVEVTSPADPRVTAYTGLTDMHLRMATEADTGLFMAEGHLVIERCANLGLEFVSVLTSPRWLNRLGEALGETDVIVYTADEAMLRDITGFGVHRGALAAVRRPPLLGVDDVLRRPGDLLVLEDLVDPTNVGLAIRSAVVQGIDSVVLSPGCADPLYRRAVKSSMGAVLRARWTRSVDWPGTLAAIARDRVLVALTPGGADRLEEAVGARPGGTAKPPLTGSFAGGHALMLGSEGPGLTHQALQAAHFRCAIPMASPGDSLNVAAASAVVCFARAQSRTMHE